MSAALAPGWTAHALRHRCASLAQPVERDVRAVQERLGRAQVTTTRGCTPVPDEARRRAAAGAGLIAVQGGVRWGAVA